MALLKSDCRIDVIILEEKYNTRYFNYWSEEQWQTIQEILKEYGITFNSPYEMNFEGEDYETIFTQKHFGATACKVLYKKKVIAKAWIDGSNYCDREAKVAIYRNVLDEMYNKG